MGRLRQSRGSIELKGPSWWLRESGRGPDGRCRPRIKLGTRTQIRTRAQARARADEWLARQRAEVIVPGPTLLAVDYLERFIQLRLPLMRRSSQAIYRSIIRRHLIPAVAGRALVEVDTAWFVRFIAARAGTLARKTLGNIRAVGLQVLRQAVRDGFGACRIESRDVRLPRRTQSEKRQRFFTAIELELLINQSPYPWSVLWAVMGYSALRVGEALALEWADVDLERRSIRIRNNTVRGLVGAPKTSTSEAEIPILSRLLEILTEYKRWSFAEGAFPRKTDLLFESRRGTPYRSDDIRRRRLQPLLARLGLPPAGLHAFRHSLPRILAERGVSAAVIQKVMRHASIGQTETYLHTRVQDVLTLLEAKGLYAPAQASTASAGGVAA